MDIAAIRNDFPGSKVKTYLNTPATGLLSKPLMEWRRLHDQDFMENGSTFKVNYFADMNRVRQMVAGFFVGQLERVSLVQNFTLGLNALVAGLRKQEKILVFQDDYPSLRWPFVERGFDVIEVPVSISGDELIRIIREQRITVWAFSLVQYLSGISVDMKMVRDVKSEFPDLLTIADGTQFCGTQLLSFSDSGLDVLGASGYKWMLGGFGCGFFIHAEGVEDRIQSKQLGYHAARYDMDNTSPSLAARLEPGHLDTFNFGSMSFSLDYLKGLGRDNVAGHLNKLSERCKSGLSELGVLDNRINVLTEHTTIFNIVGVPGLYEYLEANKVVCAPRGTGVRIGFHIYNTLEEVDFLLGLIGKKR